MRKLMKIIDFIFKKKDENYFVAKVTKYANKYNYKKAAKYLDKINIEKWTTNNCTSFADSLYITWATNENIDKSKMKGSENFLSELISRINKDHYNELYITAIQHDSYLFAKYLDSLVDELKADEAYWILLKMEHNRPTKDMFLKSILNKMNQGETEKAISYSIDGHMVNLFDDLIKESQTINLTNVLNCTWEMAKERGKNLNENTLYLKIKEKYINEEKALFSEKISNGEVRKREKRKI